MDESLLFIVFVGFVCAVGIVGALGAIPETAPLIESEIIDKLVSKLKPESHVLLRIQTLIAIANCCQLEHLVQCIDSHVNTFIALLKTFLHSSVSAL